MHGWYADHIDELLHETNHPCQVITALWQLSIGPIGPVASAPILDNVKPRHVVGGHWEDFFARSFKERPLRPAFGTSLASFHRRVRKVTSVPIYLPEPGQTLAFPMTPRY